MTDDGTKHFEMLRDKLSRSNLNLVCAKRPCSFRLKLSIACSSVRVVKSGSKYTLEGDKTELETPSNFTVMPHVHTAKCTGESVMLSLVTKMY